MIDLCRIILTKEKKNNIENIVENHILEFIKIRQQQKKKNFHICRSNLNTNSGTNQTKWTGSE